ncbi:MAG: hypothetical protein ACRD50_00185 [Candidatus Acidiferrales bacterium]
MLFGFNTELSVGLEVCHVQTEDHGPARPEIDTVVYCRGRVLHRRSSSYANLIGRPGFTEEILRKKIEDQHRATIQDLRSGTIPVTAESGRQAPPSSLAAIEVQLLNPSSWFADGTASLELEVVSRGAREPVAGAQVEVSFEGSQEPLHFAARTESNGRATLAFPMPRLGPGGAEFVIRARSGDNSDVIHYALRPKSPSGAAQRS